MLQLSLSDVCSGYSGHADMAKRGRCSAGIDLL